MEIEKKIEINLADVQERIDAAAQRADRLPSEVKLVAITKTHPAEVILAAHAAGLRDFGENRVEEAERKILAVRQRLAQQAELEWHMVGHLQRRKVPAAVQLFDWIHSVDSLRLAQRINRISEENSRVIPVLLEVNVSGEASKYGFSVFADARTGAREAFFADVEQILALSHVRLRGLMTMAPIVSNPEKARPVFVALRALRDELSRRFPEVDWRELSMGMTDDFEVAIEEGATMVRIGRAIFGERNQHR